MTKAIAVKFLGQDKDLADAYDRSIKGSDKFGAAMKGMGLAVAGAATAVGGLAVKIAFDGVRANINYAESVSKLQAVFGAQGDAMLKWAEQNTIALRLPKTALVEAIGQFGNLFDQLGFAQAKSGDMSEAVIKLAADLGSFNNVPTADVIAAQTSAFRGEYDSLQALIPTINAATVEQIALEMTGKKATKELTAQEKAAAVLETMIRGAGKAVGDAGRTADTTAGQIATLKTGFDNAKLAVGGLIMNDFLPKLLEQLGFGAGKGGDMARTVEDVQKAIVRAAPKVREIADDIGQLIRTVQGAVEWINKAANALGRLGGMGLGQNKQKGLQWSDLPGFAAGGAVGSGMPIIVGEKGPEVFVPDSAGQIIPNGARSGGAAGGGGSTTIILQLDRQVLASVTIDELERHVARNGPIGIN